MKNKILLMSTGTLVLTASVLGGMVLFQKVYKAQAEEQSNLNDLSTLVRANYPSKETIEPTKVVNSNVQFTGFNREKYEVILRDVKVLNRSSILVKYFLMDKETENTSYETTTRIDGFKPVPATQEKLNEKIDGVISIKYSEDNSKIKASDVEDSKIIFETIVGKYEASIKNKTVKITDKTVLLVTFVIKEPGGSIESKIKTLELFGFMDADLIPIPTKTKDEIDRVSTTLISMNYKEDKSKFLTSEIKNENFSFSNLSNEYELKIVHVTVSTSDPSSVVVQFTINEKGGAINSNVRSVVVDGFKKPAKSTQELKAVLDIINLASYTESTTNVELKDIDESKIKFDKLPEGFETVIHNIYAKATEKTTAVIVFSVAQKDYNVQSIRKELSIAGFKESALTPLTKTQLDTISNAISGFRYSGGDISKIKAMEIEKDKIEFIGLNHFYKIDIVSITAKNSDSSTVIVNFTIQEPNSAVKSAVKALEWSGFKKS